MRHKDVVGPANQPTTLGSSRWISRTSPLPGNSSQCLFLLLSMVNYPDRLRDITVIVSLCVRSRRGCPVSRPLWPCTQRHMNTSNASNMIHHDTHNATQRKNFLSRGRLEDHQKASPWDSHMPLAGPCPAANHRCRGLDPKSRPTFLLGKKSDPVKLCTIPLPLHPEAVLEVTSITIPT